jgi:hypothetical protein
MFQPPAAPVGGAERRCLPRSASDPSTFCCLFRDTGAALLPGRVHDLSAAGVAVELPYPLPHGWGLSAHRGNATRRFAAVKYVHVVHATPAPDGWVVGCAFDEPLDAAQLTALR